ncbi:branched-chain amino acid aminotransferase [Paraburkholderia sp. RAU6.4a]
MSMADRDGKIWMDGKLIEWRDAKIHVLTHTLHYGMGVFEGVRAYKTADGATAIFRLQEHTKRLLNSAKIFQMAVPFDHETLAAAQREVVRQNKLESCYLRPIIWVGSEKLGVSAKGNTIHVAIAAWPWGAYLGEDGITKGIRVKTSSFTRHHVNVSMVRAKASGWYVNSILANQEAIADGYDEALLLDVDGYVSEGSGENFFLVNNGKLYTPDLSSCLDGITRDTVITLACDMGLQVIEKRITRDEVYTCDEAFFTGTAAEVTPIRELDNRTIGAGARGPITEKLQSAFFDVVNGRSAKYAHCAHEDLSDVSRCPAQPNGGALQAPRIQRESLMSEIKEMPLVELSAKDLPAYCPNPAMPRWSAHPRVFIDVSHGEARCPYCSTRYKLRDGEVIKGH